SSSSSRSNSSPAKSKPEPDGNPRGEESMALQFEVNTHRIDPYKNFRFTVVWDKVVVAGVSKVSALKRTTEVVSHRHGGDLSTPRHQPGASKFEPITLERGVTFAREFQDWANLVYSPEGPGGVSLRNFRKDIVINLHNL